MADKSFQLVVRKGPRPGQLFPLTEETITIGRDPQSDIVLNDSEISRQHAQLKRAKDGGYELKDLGSTNGSFIDGRRLTGVIETLAPGQVLMFGSNVTLIYQAVSAADPMATMVGPMAAIPPIESPAPSPEPPTPAPEFEPEPELPHEPEEMGTIIDPSPSFGMPAAFEPEPEPAPEPESEPEPEPIFADSYTPSVETSDYLPQGAVGAPQMGGFGASDGVIPGTMGAPGAPPPASFVPEPPAKKSDGIGGLSRNATIAIVVVVILLCCCCLLTSLGWLFRSGNYEIDFGAAAIEIIAFYAGQLLA